MSFYPCGWRPESIFFKSAPPPLPSASGFCLHISSGLQGFALQNQLNLFGVQSLVHEQRVCQVLVLLGVGFQQGFGTFVRLLQTRE